MNGLNPVGRFSWVDKAGTGEDQVNVVENVFVGNLDAAIGGRVLYETFNALGVTTM